MKKPTFIAQINTHLKNYHTDRKYCTEKVFGRDFETCWAMESMDALSYHLRCKADLQDILRNKQKHHAIFFLNNSDRFEEFVSDSQIAIRQSNCIVLAMYI